MRTLEPNNLYPVASFVEHLNEAGEIVNSRVGIVRTAYDQATVAGQFDYPEPPGLISRDVSAFGVEIINSDGGLAATLEHIEEDEARRKFNAFLNPSGTTSATHWWFSSTLGKIGVGWPEDTHPTLRVNHPVQPEPVDPETAIYDGQTIGCSVTQGSKAVTFNASIAENAFGFNEGSLVKWDFGVGTLEAPPSRWYRIASLDVNAGNIDGLTLADTYKGPTNATASFVVSRVSDICMAMGGVEVGMLAVYYFLSEISSEQDKAHPQEWAKRFLSGIKLAAPRTSNTRTGGVPARKYGLVVS